MIIVERMAAILAVDVVFVQLRTRESTRTESARDFEDLFGHESHSVIGIPSNSAAMRRIHSVN